jgi:PII-like signaling protein
VDTGERIEAVLPKLDGLLAGGVVTVERARVIRYAGPPPTA